MIKNTLYLFLTKFIVAICSFTLLLLSAKLLGAESRGIINIAVVNLSIMLLVSELFSGPILVYFASRINNRKLISIAAIWNITSVSLVSLLLKQLKLSNDGYNFEIWITAVLQGNLGIYQMINTGNEKIKQLNIQLLLVAVIQLLSFYCIAIFTQSPDIHFYFLAWIFSLGIANVYSFFNEVRNEHLENISYKNGIILIFNKSKWIFLSNMLHLLAVRIIYFFIEKSKGHFTLGIMGTGISLSESLLLISSSISIILYARISNNEKDKKPNELFFCNAGFWLSLLGWFTLLLIPKAFWDFLIGRDFLEIHTIILFYGPSVLIMALSTILSNYFSGMGNYKISALGSGLSLIIATVLSLLLIEPFGIYGAMLVAFISNLFQLIWLIYKYNSQQSNLRFIDILANIFNPKKLFLILDK